MLQRRCRIVPPLAALALAVSQPVASAGDAGRPDVPGVVLAWPAGPLEVRVALDRPADPSLAANAAIRPFHFDTHQRTLGEWRGRGSPRLVPPLGTLNVVAARLDATRRTLILTTDPHAREAVYLGSLPLDGGGEPLAPLAYDLTGVAAAWSPGAGGEPGAAWEGWWPELDLESSRRLTRGSLEHERGYALLAKPGRLTLETQVVLPEGRLELEVVSDRPLEATLNGEGPANATAAAAKFVVPSAGEANLLAVTIATGADGRRPSLRAGYRKEGEAAVSPLPRGRQWLPWSPTLPPQPPAPAPPGFELAGGDPSRGEALFFGEQAKCSVCHKMDGRGGEVGPDLSDRAGRSRLEVFRDIAEPGATIHPDFVAHTVALKDGRVLAGVVRTADPRTLRVTDTDARTTLVPRAEVEELRPSATSIMPVGLAGALGEEKVRDLLAFLTRPRAQRRDPPAPRPR